jgi:hypothetical protein
MGPPDSLRRWFSEAGFEVGQRFEITVEPGHLRLEAVAE